jgi:hypothetical protein
MPRMNSASVSAPVIATARDDHQEDEEGTGDRIDDSNNQERVPAYLRRDMRSAMACLASLLVCPTTPLAADALVASEIVAVLVNARSGHGARAAAIDLDRYRAFAMHAFVDNAPTLYHGVLATLFRIPEAGVALPNATCHPRTAASSLTILAALVEHAPEVCVPRAPLIEGLSASANFLHQASGHPVLPQSGSFRLILMRLVKTWRRPWIACKISLGHVRPNVETCKASTLPMSPSGPFAQRAVVWFRSVDCRCTLLCKLTRPLSKPCGRGTR